MDLCIKLDSTMYFIVCIAGKMQYMWCTRNRRSTFIFARKGEKERIACATVLKVLKTKYKLHFEKLLKCLQMQFFFVNTAKAKFYDASFDIEKRKYRAIKELELALNENNESFVKRWFKLYLISLKDDHIWLGICCRHHGTSYSANERIAVMMVRLLTTFAVGALFFGESKDSAIGDITLSLYERSVNVPIVFNCFSIVFPSLSASWCIVFLLLCVW